MHKAIIAAAMFVALTTVTHAQEGVSVKRIGEAKARFNKAIWAGDTLYLSGMMAKPDIPADKAKGTPPAFSGDTKAQSIEVLKSIEAALKEQGLGLGDVVQMQAFLAGDTKKGGEADVEGWNAAYDQFFGTAEQPNKPVRATVQVAHLVLPTGLIEVMVTAVRSKK